VGAEVETPLRADAQRNREQILRAARDAFVAYGPDAPVDVIAHEAGVGTATVYRRFPDRASLVYGVALELSQRLGAELRAALEGAASGFGALRRWLHAAIDLKVGAVIPAIAGRVEVDGELRAERSRTNALLDATIRRAQDEGDLRTDAAFCDVAMIVVRLSRPSPGKALPTELELGLAHRQLEIYLAGLRPGPDEPLPGPALGLTQLEDLIAAARTRSS
jgi:AcrR family transcriptional regulator